MTRIFHDKFEILFYLGIFLTIFSTQNQNYEIIQPSIREYIWHLHRYFTYMYKECLSLITVCMEVYNVTYVS